MLAIMAGSFITGICSVTPQIFIPMVSLFSKPDEKELKTGMVLSGLLTGMLASTTIVFKVLPNVPTTYRGTFFSIQNPSGNFLCGSPRQEFTASVRDSPSVPFWHCGLASPFA